MNAPEHARSGAWVGGLHYIRMLFRSLRPGRRSMRRRFWRTPAERVDDIFDGAMFKMRSIMERRRDILPDGSRNRAYVEHLLTLGDEALLDWYCSNLHANPNRTGCPPYRVLLTLATSEWGSKHTAWDHVRGCYPCSVEIRTMHRVHEPRPA